MIRNWINDVKLLDSAQGDVVSKAYPVSDLSSIVMTIVGSDNAEFGVKFIGSMQEECPDFSGSADDTNKYFYVSVRNTGNGVNIDGDTGLTVETDTITNVLVNTPALRWIGVEITGYVGGVADVYMSGFGA